MDEAPHQVPLPANLDVSGCYVLHDDRASAQLRRPTFSRNQADVDRPDIAYLAEDVKELIHVKVAQTLRFDEIDQPVQHGLNEGQKHRTRENPDGSRMDQ